MAKKSALVFGIIFVVVGIWGFFQHPVLNLFNVNTLHDIVHILLGVILIWAGMKSAHVAMAALKWEGIVYLLLAVIGFIWGLSFVGVMAGNDPDNWLHLILGIILLAFAISSKKSSMSAPAPMSSPTPQM